MFTGIVQGTAEVIIIEAKESFQTHTVRLCGEMLSGLAIGASVAHNGCCLTVTKIADELVSFDLMQATLQLTNLGALRVGDRVNTYQAQIITL